MKMKKLGAILLMAVLSLGILTGCTSVSAVTDDSVYDVDVKKDMVPCYLNNTTMYLYEDILTAKDVRGFGDSYTLELFDGDSFVLLCNLYKTTLSDTEAEMARNCLNDYFAKTAVGLDLSKITGNYMIFEDTSPVSGKKTDFYKIVFDGVKITVDQTDLEGSVALLSYDDICVACIIGSTDKGFSESEISNMMKSVAFYESPEFSTGTDAKPSYEVPDGLNIAASEADEEKASEDETADKPGVQDEDENSDSDDAFGTDDDFGSDFDISDDLDTDDDLSIDDDLDLNSFTATATKVAAEDIGTTSLTVNKTTISLPCTFQELSDLGWIPDTYGDYEVEEDSLEVVDFTLDDGSIVSVCFANNEGKPLPLSSCTAESFIVDRSSVSRAATVIVGNSIILGETTAKDIILAAGEPDYTYGDLDYASISYNKGTDDDYRSISFDFENQILTSVNIYYSVH